MTKLPSLHRTTALVLTALVAGGIVAGVALTVFGGDSSAKVRGPAPTTTTTVALSDTARELLDRLRAGRDLELHATYTQSQEAGTLTVDVWRAGRQVRQDLVLAGDGLRNELRALQLPDGNVACQRNLGGDWACQRAASVTKAAGLFDAAAANLNGKKVTARNRRVGEHDARCYSITGGDTSSELCVTDEGIPVRLASAGSALTLVTLERSVDDDVFTPPAPLAEGAAKDS